VGGKCPGIENVYFGGRLLCQNFRGIGTVELATGLYAGKKSLIEEATVRGLARDTVQGSAERRCTR